MVLTVWHLTKCLMLLFYLLFFVSFSTLTDFWHFDVLTYGNIFVFFLFKHIWRIYKKKNRPTGQVNPSQKSPDKSGLYLFAVIVFCFSYCSKRKLSIDFISSIYKFFSSPLSKLFFFFNSSFFFKVSFVLVFSRICWKRSNVSSNSRYNWV